MKQMKFILIAGLALGSARALALKNSDPAAGNDPRPAVTTAKKIVTQGADPVQSADETEAAAARAQAEARAQEIKARAKAQAEARAEARAEAQEAKAQAEAQEAKARAQAKAQAQEAKAQAKALAQAQVQDARAQARAKVQARAVAQAEAQAEKSAAVKKAKAPKAAAAGSLEEQLHALDTSNQVPAGANREKMYAVQARYLPLKWKNEITVGGGSNLTGDSFIRTQQLEAGYHLHFGDRWSMALQHAWVDNRLKSEVDTVKTNNGALPDVPYSISRTDLTAEYNVFYGKFRWTAETVSYFDQYIALGAAQIEQNTGTSTGYVADLGFAFWLGKWGSTRIGLKDYYYKEEYRSGPLWTNNLHAHLDIGYLF